eukprot:GEZU01022965.1.p1 GENE.GEZU01022965.1~~GEZU01022965.1.p1  ORF type:complete len:186 (-),score=33.34 GEZU01022965.1:6-563(-)
MRRMLLDNIYFYLAMVPVSLMGLLYWKQNLLLYVTYFPKDSRGKFTYLPSRFNLPFEDIWLRTKDGVKIHCWFIKQQHENAHNAPTIIYFHGNAGNISHRLPHVKNLFNATGCNILQVSYRGYGMSEGEPTEQGLKYDADAALDYLRYERKDINPNQIFLLGRSLGGAVTLNLFASREDEVCEKH